MAPMAATRCSGSSRRGVAVTGSSSLRELEAAGSSRSSSNGTTGAGSSCLIQSPQGGRRLGCRSSSGRPRSKRQCLSSLQSLIRRLP